jgi:hypothetical protein
MKKALPTNSLLQLTPQKRSKRGLPCCWYCGKLLPIWLSGPDSCRGRYGRGFFCRDICAHDWAESIIEDIHLRGNVIGPWSMTLKKQRAILDVMKED